MQPSLTHGLQHRLISFALASIPLADNGMAYAADGNPWRLLGMLGWLLVSLAWFLRPAVLARPWSDSPRRTERLALISPKRWGLLLGIGLVIALLAVVLRHANAA